MEESVSTSASDFLGLVGRNKILIFGFAAVTTALAGLYVAGQTPQYRATAELLVDPQALQVVGKDIVRSDTAASIDFAGIDSQALVMASTSVLDQLVDELRLDEDPAFRAAPGLVSRLLGRPSPAQTRSGVIENLRKSVVARRVDNSLVFDVTVSHPNSERSAEIANRLAGVYLRQGNEGRGAAVKRANDNLLGQLSNLRAQLNAAETAVEKFRSAQGLISTGEAGLIVNQQLRDLYTQITAAETDLARLGARKDQLAKLGPDALLSDRIPEALNSPTITALRSSYAAAARDAARLAETLLPRHPRLMEARGELSAARSSLSEELDRIRASIVEDFAQARANLDKLKERAASLTRSQVSSSESEIRLRQLESEADAVRAVYSASLGRAKELEQQEKIETSNSRLISAATAPARPSAAPAAIVLPAAAVFGAVLGVAIAFLADLLRGAAPSARAVAAMFGVDMFVTTSRRPGASALDDRDRAGLVAVARRLQDRTGAANPAIVVVAGALDLDPQVRRNIIAALGRALAELGEGVWICLHGDRDDPMHIERIRPIQTVDVQGQTVGGPLMLAAKRAQSIRLMEALQGRPSSRGETSEFFLLSDDHAAGLAASAGNADAIVLLMEPGRTRRRAIRDLVALIDPTAERIAAIVGVEPPAGVSIKAPGFAMPNWRFRKAAA